MSTILLIEDHPIVVAACRLLLESGDEISLVEARDAAAGYQAFLQHQPDVIIVDLRLGGHDLAGLDLIERIRLQAPRAAILVFSMHVEPRIVRAAIAAGATGYLLKDAPSAELAKAVEQVRSGQHYMDQGLATRLALLGTEAESNPGAALTRRERQALSLLAEGASYPVVADRLGISYKTVVNIAYRLRQKLNAKSLPDLIRKAIELTRPKS